MKLEPRILELLNKRGIFGEEELSEFLSAKPQKTYDPFLLLNMEAGVDLILSAIEENEKICIYGDYDADGITSTSLMLEVLSNLTKNLTYYIPSRFDEGYGLNCQALQKIKEHGVGLVITVDCGSVSVEEVAYAKEIGLKILVTDHHTITDKIADCIVINPQQPGCPYPCKYLAGVGVAFKVAQAVAEMSGLPKNVVTRTLDLVGIGTIGDIVPLLDENRTLAKYGLRAINVSKRLGLQKLIEGVGLKQGEISSENISYVIVPHLNASGRMGSARTAVSLLMSRENQKVAECVQQLIERNRNRKQIQSDTYEACIEEVEKGFKDDLFYVIDLEDAHEGITGIVAGKVKDTYNRPVVIVTPTADECLKGTARSIENVNLYQLLKENEHMFTRFGGHAAACGFTMKREYLTPLRENLNSSMRNLLTQNPQLLLEKEEADMILEAEDINLQLIEEMNLLEPFGCCNPRPKVEVSLLPHNLSRMGNKGQFTRFMGILDNQKEIKCVIFKDAGKYDELLQSGEKISIIGTLDITSWNGRQSMQITVCGAEK